MEQALPFLRCRKDKQLYELIVNYQHFCYSPDYDSLCELAQALCNLSRFQAPCHCSVHDNVACKLLRTFEVQASERELRLYNKDECNPLELDRLSKTFDWSRRYYFDSPVESLFEALDLEGAERLVRCDPTRTISGEIAGRDAAELRLDEVPSGNQSRCHYVAPTMAVHQA